MTSLKGPCGARLLVLGLLAAGPAAAQETAQAIIITATGLAQDRNENGQAISVIDSAVIERA